MKNSYKILVFTSILTVMSCVVFGNKSEANFTNIDGFGIQMDMDDATVVACDIYVVSSVAVVYSSGENVSVNTYLVEYSSIVNDVGSCLIGYVEKYDLPLPYY